MHRIFFFTKVNTTLSFPVFQRSFKVQASLDASYDENAIYSQTCSET